MQIIKSLQVGLRRSWKCDCSMKTCCLYTSCSNDNRAAVCLCYRFPWTNLLYIFKFVFSSSFFLFPLLLSNFKWDLGSEVHHSVHKPFCPSWDHCCSGVVSPNCWGSWAEHWEWAKKTLVLGRTGGYCSWDPGWNTFWHESSFPSGEKRGFPSCTAVCQLCWYVGMCQMEGSQTDWHCEVLKLLGCLCSRKRFCSCLAMAPNLAPAQKLSCLSALLSSGDVTLGVSAELLSTVWGRRVRCSWQTHPASSCGVLNGSGTPVIQDLPANLKQCFLLLQFFFFLSQNCFPT